MIERIYIHNYKGFVNFEMKCGPFVFLMGRNGSGKSSVLEVLEKLASLISGAALLKYALPESTRYRFGEFPTQEFELSVRLDGDLFRYRIEIEPRGAPPVTAIRLEELTVNGSRLFALENGVLELRGNAGELIASFPHNSEESVCLIDLSKQNRKSGRFQSWARSLLRLQLDPLQVGSESVRGRGRLEPRGRNFANWLDEVAHADTERMLGYFRVLDEVLPGFKSINWRPLARTEMALEAVFDSGGSRATFDFDELSEGQKCLIVLYAVLHFGLGKGGCVALDEPDNFLALSEIEPFLHALEDAVEQHWGEPLG